MLLQTLHRIASSFGPLESFDLRSPEPAEESTGELHVLNVVHLSNFDYAEYPTYSYPHNADRSEGMDPGCWEIKWVNRNDCLSALAASHTLSTPPSLLG
jgi:hypothetical protein